MPKPCYFEIPAADVEQAKSFYSDLFDWQFSPMPGTDAALDYHAINMGPADEKGMPYGGLMKKQHPEHQLTPYINVEAIEPYLQKAVSLGATVLMNKTPVTGKGYFALILDPDNNPIGLWVCDETA